MNDQQNSGKKPVLWPYFIAAVALGGISLNVALVFIATNDRDDLVRRDYYEAGLRYQQEIDRKSALRTDWRLAVDEGSLNAGAESVLRICATDTTGKALQGGKVSAVLVRPDNADLDLDLQLMVGDTPGCHEIPVTLGPTGVWKLDAELLLDGDAAALEKRLWVQ